MVLCGILGAHERGVSRCFGTRPAGNVIYVAQADPHGTITGEKRVIPIKVNKCHQIWILLGRAKTAQRSNGRPSIWQGLTGHNDEIFCQWMDRSRCQYAVLPAPDLLLGILLPHREHHSCRLIQNT